ncbi:protein MOTHER of FT and TFL1 homolog 1-like [Coffea eugenioides]|uniref:Protein MOTHER of FT and TFL1 homolog 1-like n=1 Tax=Coffea arabica TaxID=13443 RepID=A0A6P6W8D7_COFAR|nr:protein MOTHER of FT and TFL1 homolog 1-like [Coffea arabica]XP_027162685.1 protein MOTHER of FT and TFL1 homolog 1-like [Coffea eugenioides]
MARPVEPLVVGRVIGDVLDMFVPAAELIVQYGSKQVGNGCEIKPSHSAHKPAVRVNGSRARAASLFTLVMVDPDAPSPSDPTFREWLHWIVVNIPEGGDASEGKELVAYQGPQPPTGIHRYVFALFKQRGRMEKPKTLPEPRHNFTTRQFASHNELGLPVAAVYFNSQKEPAGNRKR